MSVAAHNAVAAAAAAAAAAVQQEKLFSQKFSKIKLGKGQKIS
jgi:hypothetical protein